MDRCIFSGRDNMSCDHLIPLADVDLHPHIIKLLDNETKGTLLDIAAGQGALSCRLSKMGYKVTSIDINENNFNLHDKIEFIKLNLNEEFYLNRKFDNVCAVEIIEHLENPYKLIRDCHKLLNTNGNLIISTPNITNYKSRLMYLIYGRFNSFFPHDKINSGHINPIPLWELKHIIEENGFKIDSITSTKLNINSKSKLLRILYCIGLLTLPFISNFGFRENRNTNTGNINVIQAHKVGD